MISVNGLSPYVRAILDSFEEDYEYRWICPCGFVVYGDSLTLLGLVDECIKHVETDPKHN